MIMIPKTTDVVLNDNGFKVSIDAKADTVGELLDNIGVVLTENDHIDYSLSSPLETDMEITINRAMLVNIESGPDKTVVPMLSGGTVADALGKANIEIGPDDEVYPGMDQIVMPGTTVTHIIVTKEQKIEEKTIGYKEVTKKNSSMEVGKEKVTSNGSEGLMEVTFEVTYKNGIEVRQEKIKDEVVRKPTDKVTEIGTKPKATPKPSGSANTKKWNVNPEGKLVQTPKTSQIYSSSLADHRSAPKPDSSIIKETRRARNVTAYANGKRTAAGTYPRIGSIACYWKILPKGTKIYVPGYGYGNVEDQGANKNTDNLDLDLHFGHGDDALAACRKWGRKKNVEFYILK